MWFVFFHFSAKIHVAMKGNSPWCELSMQVVNKRATKTNKRKIKIENYAKWNIYSTWSAVFVLINIVIKLSRIAMKRKLIKIYEKPAILMAYNFYTFLYCFVSSQQSRNTVYSIHWVIDTVLHMQWSLQICIIGPITYNARYLWVDPILNSGSWFISSWIRRFIDVILLATHQIA